MSATDSFIYFRALPSELRLQIWKEALAVRSVWAAINTNNPRPYGRPFHMVFIGPAPYLAGLSCREARRVLEQSYPKPLRGPFGPPANSDTCHWVDLNTTVVHFGNFSASVPVRDSFRTDELSRFKHVALPWYSWSQLARTCQSLVTLCPDLRTIIVQCMVTESATDHSLLEPLDIEMAAYYATLPGCPGPELGHGELDAFHYRSLLLAYFGASPPRIHFLAPGSAICSPHLRHWD